MCGVCGCFGLDLLCWLIVLLIYDVKLDLIVCYGVCCLWLCGFCCCLLDSGVFVYVALTWVVVCVCCNLDFG